MRSHVFFAIGCSVFTTFFATTVRAQSAEGFALDRFAPSERGSRWFALDSLDLQGNARPAFGTVGAWARNPLVVRSATGDVRTPIVEQQLVMHAGGSIVFADRFRVAANLPIGAYQSGQPASVDGSALPPPSSTALGDARLSGDVRIIGTYRGIFTSTLGVELGLPTGNRDAYMSDHVFSATPRALAAGRVGPFVYAGRLGVHLRPGGTSYAGSEFASSVVFGAAAGVELAGDRVHVGAELFGSTAVAGNDAFSARKTPLEILFGGHARVVDDVIVGVGVGPGITRADGSPDVRGLASLEWAPRAAARGAPSPRQVTPEPVPEPQAIPEPVATIADRDEDGIEDSVDACPDNAGPEDADPAKSGCAVAELVGSTIRIRDQVKFRMGSADLDPTGDFTLVAIATVLEEHPEIKQVLVEGHTDSVGPTQDNATLSTARARAVVGWLSTHGVEATRLDAKGVGAERPLTTNATDEGRRLNRRVEFHVASKTESQ